MSDLLVRKAKREAASAMLAALKESQEALDVLAGDVEDTFPARAEAAADLAMRLRATIAQAKAAGITEEK